MDDYIALSKDLAAAARPCFNDVDRDFVDMNLDAGESFCAVEDTLYAAAREKFALPADLIDRVRQWADTTAGNEAFDRLRELLAQVRVDTAAARRSA